MLIDVEHHDNVAVIYLNDPNRKNALSTKLIKDLMAGITATATAEHPARALVIANRGTDFCAGADIRDMLGTGWLEKTQPDSAQPTPVDLFKMINRDPRPIVAAVRGLVLGGGVELATVCDLVVAGSETSFRLPEIGLGVLPNTALGRLPAIIGRRRAAELILSRRVWLAGEAERIGFVNAVVPENQLVEHAIDMAGQLVKSAPPAAISGVKSALGTDDWEQIDSFLQLMDSDEWREGTTAFTEKRRPDYERFWRKS